MTFTTSYASPLVAASLRERLTTFGDALSGRLARRRAYRATLAQLDALSDRDLADVGVHRSQVVRVALEATART